MPRRRRPSSAMAGAYDADDEAGIALFCKIEAALADRDAGEGRPADVAIPAVAEAEKPIEAKRVVEDDCFPGDYLESLAVQLAKERDNVAREKRAVERERMRLAKDREIIDANLQGFELARVRSRYRALKERVAGPSEIVDGPPVRIVGSPIAHYRCDVVLSYSPGAVVSHEFAGQRWNVTFESGERGVAYANGAIRLRREGNLLTYFKNRDVSCRFADGAEAYRFESSGVIELVLGDGTRCFRYPDGQEEIHMRDGSRRVAFADGSVRTIGANGDWEHRRPSHLVERCEGGLHRVSFQ